MKDMFSKIKIGVVGLGYVGLPLAVEFSKQFPVIGFDVNKQRVTELEGGIDRTQEITCEELLAANGLTITNDQCLLADCNCYIVAVPTPIDAEKQPDLLPLFEATKIVGQVLSDNDVVIYESTVFPGVTEQECAPILERISGLTYAASAKDSKTGEFHLGYSPERVNPGDKLHRLTDIVKVTSGSSEKIATFVDELYSSIITAGTFKAATIRVAEAAKVIENTQRDVNIALINELSIIFEKLGIKTSEVLEAAETKWNFLPFKPGLVGGHCIGVDPYYLTFKAKQIGYTPDVILAGRSVNDGMALEVVRRVCDLMTAKNIELDKANVLIMGLTFKENCPDTRNSKVFDMMESLQQRVRSVEVYDPNVSPNDLPEMSGKFTPHLPKDSKYDAIVLAVAHDEFKDLTNTNIRNLGKPVHVLFDVKNILQNGMADGSL